MDLFCDLGKAFDLIWAASDELAGSLDAPTRSPAEQRLRALRADFQCAEAAGDQAMMLQLAREMTSLGSDLVDYRKKAAP